MKRILLTLTLLSLINAEAFASQSQPAKPTSSWLSWASYAAGVAALGTGAGIYFYRDYSERYKSQEDEVKRLVDRSNERIRSLDEEARALTSIRETAYMLRHVTPKDSQRTQALKGAIDQLPFSGIDESNLRHALDLRHDVANTHLTQSCHECGGRNDCSRLNQNLEESYSLANKQLADNDSKKKFLKNAQKEYLARLQPVKRRKTSLLGLPLALGFHLEALQD